MFRKDVELMNHFLLQCSLLHKERQILKFVILTTLLSVNMKTFSVILFFLVKITWTLPPLKKMLTTAAMILFESILTHVSFLYPTPENVRRPLVRIVRSYFLVSFISISFFPRYTNELYIWRLLSCVSIFTNFVFILYVNCPNSKWNPNPQSRLNFRDFQCSKLLNGCLLILRNEQMLRRFPWYFRILHWYTPHQWWE